MLTVLMNLVMLEMLEVLESKLELELELRKDSGFDRVFAKKSHSVRLRAVACGRAPCSTTGRTSHRWVVSIEEGGFTGNQQGTGSHEH